MKYRAEIDGLRALAVIPVVLFHTGVEIFSGGFVGVDVFFVISGYLITTLLIEDIENKKFSIINFYERRARRILPAFFFMVFSCLIIGWFILTPYFYRDLLQTSFAISIFSSNVLLYIKSGYFDSFSQLKPFLHTWSLAVEEQYYILFPILLIMFWKLGKNATLFFLSVLFIISLLLSEWLLNYDSKANFYLLPSRAWELLAGSIAAFITQKKGVKKNNILALIGLSAIFFSIYLFDEKTPSPSFYTLIPVLGVVLLILFGNRETLVARFLGTKPLVWIGLLSYSIYLWHQPLLSFLRHSVLGKPSNFQYLCANILIILVSYLSWRYVEHPFRNKGKFNRKFIFIGSITVIFIAGSLGLLGNKKMGYPSRLGPETQSISMGSFDKNPNQSSCIYLNKFDTLNDACLLGVKKGVTPSIAIVGDSYGDHLAFSLDEALKLKGMTAYNFSFLGCFPINFKQNSSEFYNNLCFEKITNFLNNNKNIETVIISYNWSSIINTFDFKNEISSKVSRNENLNQVRANIVARKIEDFAGSSKKLILVYPIPEPGVDVPIYTVKRRILGDKNFTLQMPYELFEAQYKAVYSAFNSIKANIKRIFPSDLYCEPDTSKKCKTILNGKTLYYDTNHLSNYGASLLMPSIISSLNNK